MTSQGIMPRNALPWSEIESEPRRVQTVRYIHSPTELSWLGPWRGQTVRYIHSPTELSWPELWRVQTVRFIHSPTELSWFGSRKGPRVRYIILPLSYHDPGHGEGRQWDTFILPLSHFRSASIFFTYEVRGSRFVVRGSWFEVILKTNNENWGLTSFGSSQPLIQIQWTSGLVYLVLNNSRKSEALDAICVK